MNSEFSFIILTYNEEVHLHRLLQSISTLHSPVFILDSGSTDGTINIAKEFGASILYNTFENHPKQWDFALKNFNIQTPWIIGLDADQIVTPQLNEKLKAFKDEDYRHVNGIYFNRKNYFKGRWIKHGGYYPFYMLKMIRFKTGYSDLNENMDHRFIVPGHTIIWKDGIILEENLKENEISFWIDKHNRYSSLLAIEEVERMKHFRQQTIKPDFWGTPNGRNAWLKQLWWKLPRYVRPPLYFFYRIFFQLGILDGTTGVIFHFLQGCWFRLVVDIKIDEILDREKKPGFLANADNKTVFNFLISFILLFTLFYYFNIYYFSTTLVGSSHYCAFLTNHFNYIRGLRLLLLNCSSQILKWLGFAAITNEYDLLVAGHGTIQLVYSCLGLGIISFFSAFVLSYPKNRKRKVIFLISGVFGIEILNIIRFVMLALFWDKHKNQLIDHHVVFNIFIYLIISVSLYFWVKSDNPLNKNNAANKSVNL